ncbi:hypothetical protein M514_14166 [Trichuris suis]|uniref:G-protein coupled receptors family 1 profile domain-containing protein n=2 Tax=Trichuris suis TaxID=68888 RepID=A0A085NIA2_9BILA|nr:hypothetical protein M514_14166 [Trichuris suis]
MEKTTAWLCLMSSPYIFCFQVGNKVSSLMVLFLALDRCWCLLVFPTGRRFTRTYAIAMVLSVFSMAIIFYLCIVAVTYQWGKDRLISVLCLHKESIPLNFYYFDNKFLITAAVLTIIAYLIMMALMKRCQRKLEGVRAIQLRREKIVLTKIKIIVLSHMLLCFLPPFITTVAIQSGTFHISMDALRLLPPIGQGLEVLLYTYTLRDMRLAMQRIHSLCIKPYELLKPQIWRQLHLRDRVTPQ